MLTFPPLIIPAQAVMTKTDISRDIAASVVPEKHFSGALGDLFGVLDKASAEGGMVAVGFGNKTTRKNLPM